MVAAKETAEEQLLRMIEGPIAGPQMPRRTSRYAAVERLVESLRSACDVVWRWLFPPPQGREKADGLLWRLRVAERIVWAVLAGLGLYVIIDLVFMQRRPPTMALKPAQALGSRGLATPTAEDRLKPMAEYQQALVARNPFGLSTPAAVATEQSQSQLTERTKGLVVVGLNRGRVPEALIEDTTAQRTYVVKIGDQFNGLTVKSISPQGVVVSYGNEETILQ